MVSKQRSTSLVAKQAQVRHRQQPGDEWPWPRPPPHQREVEQTELQEGARVVSCLLGRADTTAPDEMQPGGRGPMTCGELRKGVIDELPASSWPNNR